MSHEATSDRSALMQRVYAALGRSQTQAPPPAPAVDESLARLARPSDDLVKLFHTRAAATGMFVHRPSADQLAQHIIDFLKQQNVRSVVLATVPPASTLAPAIAAAGIRVVDWKSAANTNAHTRLDAQFDVDCGITGVHAALAETGTLVLYSDAHHSRGLSLVPPLHIAIVYRRDILPDMLDHWARLRGIPGSDLPSNMVFITGPSKTADIEGELVTGVHGPEAVHIMLVEE